MTDQELRRLRRRDLLEILVAQSREIDRLKRELAQTEAREAERRLAVEQAGTMAEAALRIHRVFEAADRAAQQYMENIIAQAGERQAALCREREAQSREKCLRMEQQTRACCRWVLERAQAADGARGRAEAEKDMQALLDKLQRELQQERDEA